MNGCVHLYWGEGKGKTTAAMGLALRALGHGKQVVIVQFLKGTPSGEIAPLEKLGARVLRCAPGQKFVFQMNAAEKAACRTAQTALLQQALALPADLLILDEACSVWALDMIDRPLLEQAVKSRPAAQELVLTGHDPARWMLDMADYCTEMHCCRHPYQNDLPARQGIEF